MLGTVEQRFHARIKKPIDGGCTIFRGAKIRGGFGLFRVGKKFIAAHRVAYMLAHPECNWVIDPKMRVCHSCDNPGCINPDHLYLDTPSNNMARVAATRQLTHGEANYRAKFTNEQVLAIRQMALDKTHTQAEMAALYGVATITIGKIVQRKRWAHI